MSCITKCQRFQGRFSEVDVWSPIIAKRIVLHPMIAIFSNHTCKKEKENKYQWFTIYQNARRKMNCQLLPRLDVCQQKSRKELFLHRQLCYIFQSTQEGVDEFLQLPPKKATGETKYVLRGHKSAFSKYQWNNFIINFKYNSE